MRQGVDLHVTLLVDTLQAGEGVDTVNVHRATSANTLPARPPERERRVKLVLDLENSVEDHGTALVEVDRVGLEVGLLSGLVGVLYEDKRVNTEERWRRVRSCCALLLLRHLHVIPHKHDRPVISRSRRRRLLSSSSDAPVELPLLSQSS